MFIINGAFNVNAARVFTRTYKIVHIVEDFIVHTRPPDKLMRAGHVVMFNDSGATRWIGNKSISHFCDLHPKQGLLFDSGYVT